MLDFNPQPKVTKKKLKSEKKRLQVRCWKLMSEWVRRSGASFSGMVQCFTCPKTSHWKEMQAGHYQHNKLDFDERNIHVQCPQCNLYKSGALDAYTMRLIGSQGVEWVQQLRTDAAKHPGYTVEELKTIEADLKARLILLPKV